MKIIDLKYCGGKYELKLIVLKNSSTKFKFDPEQLTSKMVNNTDNMNELLNANSDEGTTEFHNLEMSSQSCSSSGESRKGDGGSMSIHNTFY